VNVTEPSGRCVVALFQRVRDRVLQGRKKGGLGWQGDVRQSEHLWPRVSLEDIPHGALPHLADVERGAAEEGVVAVGDDQGGGALLPSAVGEKAEEDCMEHDQPNSHGASLQMAVEPRLISRSDLRQLLILCAGPENRAVERFQQEGHAHVRPAVGVADG
jgi:hypothetical protein